MKLAVLSDVHGNLEAFEAVLEDMKSQGIDDAISLGDIIGYGPDPGPCVDLMIESKMMSIMGNHEWVLKRNTHRRWFNVSSRVSVDLTAHLLTEKQLEYVTSLPETALWHNTLCVHGSPPDSILRYLHQYDDKSLARAMDKMPVDICFVGHTHDLMVFERDSISVERHDLPEGTMELKEETRYIINAGAVGQPRDDYNTQAKYLIWEPEKNSVTVRFVPYDVEKTIEKMHDRGFQIDLSND